MRSDCIEADSFQALAVASNETGMAHFGIAGVEHCRDCRLWKPLQSRSRSRYCSKFVEMTGDTRKSISGNAYACKYFEAAA